jgi:hypothetical protein
MCVPESRVAFVARMPVEELSSVQGRLDALIQSVPVP